MNYREFRSLVTSMRAAQKQYFRTRDSGTLEYCKQLEKHVDAELRDVGQAKMFDEKEQARLDRQDFESAYEGAPEIP